MSILSEPFPQAQLVLDASAIFNLLGCGKCNELLEILPGPCLVADKTLSEIQRHPGSGECPKPILSQLASDGKLISHRMTDIEYEIYLSLVSGELSKALDDGEGAAIAVAVNNNAALVLDDAKARRHVKERYPSVPIVSSLSLIVFAGETAGWRTRQIAEVVLAARRVSRMNTIKGEEYLLKSIGLRIDSPQFDF